MTLLFTGKSQAAARGGTKPKAYPPLMRLAQTARQIKSENVWSGKGKEKIIIILCYKSYKESMFLAISFATESRRSSGCAI